MSDDLKGKILETASSLFQARGVRDVTIEDVCRGLSISKKTFYLYYPQKEDLVYAVVLRGFEKQKQYLTYLFSGKNVVEILRCFYVLLEQNHGIELEGRMASDIAKYYPETFREITRIREREIQKAFVQYLRQGQDEGLFRPDLDVEAQAMIFGFIHKGIAKYSSDTPSAGKKISRKRLCLASAQDYGWILFTPAGRAAYQEQFNDKQYDETNE